MDVPLALGLAGLMILLGLLASHLSGRMGLPDIPILVAFGLLLGPGAGLVQPGGLGSIAPFFGALAIAIILFEGGLHMNMMRVLTQVGRALLLAAVGFILSMLVVGSLAPPLLGWPLEFGLLLGSILGGTSSVVVFTLVKRARVGDRVEALLGLEATLTDAFVVVVSMGLIQLLSRGFGSSPLVFTAGIGWSLILGGLGGGLAGLLWMKVLERVWYDDRNDIATVAILLALYALLEAVGGSGAVGALTFGLTLGNGPQLLAGGGVGPPAEAITRRFHRQLSFTLRTFFFIYLGIIFNPANLHIFIPGLILTLALLAARYGAVWLASLGDDILRLDAGPMAILFPRGLAAAVLAQAAAGTGVPRAGELVDLVLTVIMLSTLASSLGVGLVGRGWIRRPTGRPAHRGRDEGVEGYRAWFRRCLVEHILKHEVREDVGPWVVDDYSMGGYRPTLCLEGRGGLTIYEAIADQRQLLELPGRIRELQSRGFGGEYRMVVALPTACRYLSRLLALEGLCHRSRDALGFDIRFYTLDVAGGRLLPLAQLRSILERRGPSESRLAGLVMRVHRRLSSLWRPG